MTQPFERIESDFEQFRRAVADCRVDNSFRPEQWKDAYGALGRLRERYQREKGRLTSMQRAPLEKVLENDKFIKGMISIRHVGEHVKRHKPFKLWTTTNVPLFFEGTANAMFAGPAVTLDDVNGEPRQIDHLQRLDEALKRIDNALDRARKRD